MDYSNPRQRAAFFDLHSDNPREAPGDRASTLRALAAVTAEHNPRRILDIGCGPGLQTQHLLDELLDESNTKNTEDDAIELVAADLNPPFVAQVNQWSANYPAGVVRAVQADMTKLRLGELLGAQPFDLIWCEGAAYIMGITEALRQWRSLLTEPGYIAFTECVFLQESVPEAVQRNWAEYPAMTTVEGAANWVREAGFELLDCFVLPPEAWWAYYDPLQLRVDKLRDRYLNDPDGTLVIEEGQSEIDVYREYGDYFGYAFFVARSEPRQT